MGIKVTPDVLIGAGRKILDSADALHLHISRLDGAQEGTAGANDGFMLATVAAECETGWEDALRPLGGQIAVAGDLLQLNADTWANIEETNTETLRPR